MAEAPIQIIGAGCTPGAGCQRARRCRLGGQPTVPRPMTGAAAQVLHQLQPRHGQDLADRLKACKWGVICRNVLQVRQGFGFPELRDFVTCMLDVFFNLTGWAMGAHSWLSGIAHGKKFRELESKLDHIGSNVERLASGLYVPKARAIILPAGYKESSPPLHEAKRMLNACTPFLKDTFASSILVIAPENLTKAIRNDPYLILTNITDLDKAEYPSIRGLIPIAFEHSGSVLIGWQTEGILEMLFGCKFVSDVNLWVPKSYSPDARKREYTAVVNNQVRINCRWGANGEFESVL